MMMTCDVWINFLECVKTRCSATAFGNWLLPIKVVQSTDDQIALEIPNIFVKEYLLSNFKSELLAFLPVNAEGEPAIQFTIEAPTKKAGNVSGPKTEAVPVESNSTAL